MWSSVVLVFAWSKVVCITRYAARNPFTIDSLHKIASATLELPTTHLERVNLDNFVPP